MGLDPVSRFRRFSRAVTTEVGALDDSFLGRGRPLGAARVLNAVGHGRSDVAEMRRYLDLDSGLASRLLRGLETEGLLETRPHPDDARRRIAVLTEAGRAEFAIYEDLSNGRARTILARHRDPDGLLDAMDRVTVALAAERIEIGAIDPRGELAERCLAAYYAELAARMAGGYDPARVAPVADVSEPPEGTFLAATIDGMPVGCVTLRTRDGFGEVKRLWVARHARGIGLGRKLMESIEEAATGLGMRTLRLDTSAALTEAVQLYRRGGWREIERYNDDPHPDLFFEKTL